MIRVGDKVEKTHGYKWPGVVVSAFRTLAGAPRFVVECTVPEVAGALHIYNDDQLIVRVPRQRPDPTQFFVEGRWLDGDDIETVAILAGVTDDVVKTVLTALGEVKT